MEDLIWGPAGWTPIRRRQSSTTSRNATPRITTSVVTSATRRLFRSHFLVRISRKMGGGIIFFRGGTTNQASAKTNTFASKAGTLNRPPALRAHEPWTMWRFIFASARSGARKPRKLRPKRVQSAHWLTPPKVNSSPLKNGGWKTSLSYWVSVTFEGRTVQLWVGY